MFTTRYSSRASSSSSNKSQTDYHKVFVSTIIDIFMEKICNPTHDYEGYKRRCHIAEALRTTFQGNSPVLQEKLLRKIMGYAKDKNPLVRESVILVLGGSGLVQSKHVVECLVDALNDTDIYVRSHAADALCRLGIIKQKSLDVLMQYKEKHNARYSYVVGTPDTPDEAYYTERPQVSLNELSDNLKTCCEALLMKMADEDVSIHSSTLKLLEKRLCLDDEVMQSGFVNQEDYYDLSQRCEQIAKLLWVQEYVVEQLSLLQNKKTEAENTIIMSTVNEIKKHSILAESFFIDKVYDREEEILKKSALHGLSLLNTISQNGAEWLLHEVVEQESYPLEALKVLLKCFNLSQVTLPLLVNESIPLETIIECFDSINRVDDMTVEHLVDLLYDPEPKNRLLAAHALRYTKEENQNYPRVCDALHEAFYNEVEKFIWTTIAETLQLIDNVDEAILSHLKEIAEDEYVFKDEYVSEDEDGYYVMHPVSVCVLRPIHILTQFTASYVLACNKRISPKVVAQLFCIINQQEFPRGRALTSQQRRCGTDVLYEIDPLLPTLLFKIGIAFEENSRQYRWKLDKSDDLQELYRIANELLPKIQDGHSLVSLLVEQACNESHHNHYATIQTLTEIDRSHFTDKMKKDLSEALSNLDTKASHYEIFIYLLSKLDVVYISEAMLNKLYLQDDEYSFFLMANVFNSISPKMPELTEGMDDDRIDGSKKMALQAELTQACYDADIKKVQGLIENQGASPVMPDEDGQSPLAAAIWGLGFLVMDYLDEKVKPIDWQKAAMWLQGKHNVVIPCSGRSKKKTYGEFLEQYQSNFTPHMLNFERVLHLVRDNSKKIEALNPYYQELEEDKEAGFITKLSKTKSAEIEYTTQYGKRKQIHSVDCEAYFITTYVSRGVKRTEYNAGFRQTTVYNILFDAMRKLLYAQGVKLTGDFRLKETNGLVKQQGELTQACYQANLARVKELIEQKKSDPTLPDYHGQKPLAAAIWGLAVDVVNYLVPKLHYKKQDWYAIFAYLQKRHNSVLPMKEKIGTYKAWYEHFNAEVAPWLYKYSDAKKRECHANQMDGSCEESWITGMEDYGDDNDTISLMVWSESTYDREIERYYGLDDPITTGRGQVSFFRGLCESMNALFKRYGIQLSENYQLSEHALDSFHPIVQPQTTQEVLRVSVESQSLAQRRRFQQEAHAQLVLEMAHASSSKQSLALQPHPVRTIQASNAIQKLKATTKRHAMLKRSNKTDVKNKKVEHTLRYSSESGISSNNDIRGDAQTASKIQMKDYSNIQLFFTQNVKSSKKSLPPLGNSTVKTNRKNEADFETQAKNEKKNKAIGDAGEEHVYKMLKNRLKTNLNVEPASLESQNGVRFTKDNHGKQVEVDLIWFNKTRKGTDVEESPVDIVIAVDGVERYFIEVKSTNDKRNPYFYITGSEWKYMQIYREKSILVRVYNTQSQEPFFEVFKDPFRMITEGWIQFHSGGRFQLTIPDDEHDASLYSLQDYQDDDIGCKIS